MTHQMKGPVAAAVQPYDEDGMTTAEYAVGTVSACSFAGILYTILTSGLGQTLLQNLLDKVLGILPF